jgi:hypothetical protein
VAGPESEAGILDGVVAREMNIVCLLDYIGLVSVVECICIHLDLNPNFRVYILLKELLDGGVWVMAYGEEVENENDHGKQFEMEVRGSLEGDSFEEVLSRRHSRFVRDIEEQAVEFVEREGKTRVCGCLDSVEGQFADKSVIRHIAKVDEATEVDLVAIPEVDPLDTALLSYLSLARLD